jgi:thymidylate synthase (FAD)
LEASVRVDVLDHGYVELVEGWGSDERVIEAARMSTNKGFIGWGDEATPGDEKLLRYLWANRHATPFEMAGFVVEVQAPIFVFREWHRHRTQSYNEMSARYTKMPDLHYVPAEGRVRRQDAKNKQGTGQEALPPEVVEQFLREVAEQQAAAYAAYERYIAAGIPKELARINTPVSRYGRMRALANLRNWLGFLALRMDSAAQEEIRMYADAVGTITAHLFPRTWGLFSESRNA